MDLVKMQKNSLYGKFGEFGEPAKVKIVVASRGSGKIRAYKEMLNDAIDRGEKIMVIRKGEIIHFNKEG